MKRHAFIFSGATHGTMLRDEGWYWLSLGRHLERLIFTTRVLGVADGLVALDEDGPVRVGQQYLSTVLLRILSAFDPYRRTYRAVIQPTRAVEFLLFNRQFPRSAVGSAERVASCCGDIGLDAAGPVLRLAGRLAAELRYREVSDVTAEGVATYMRRISDRAEVLHAALSETAFERGDFTPTIRSVDVASL